MPHNVVVARDVFKQNNENFYQIQGLVYNRHYSFTHHNVEVSALPHPIKGHIIIMCLLSQPYFNI